MHTKATNFEFILYENFIYKGPMSRCMPTVLGFFGQQFIEIVEAYEYTSFDLECCSCVALVHIADTALCLFGYFLDHVTFYFWVRKKVCQLSFTAVTAHCQCV